MSRLARATTLLALGVLLAWAAVVLMRDPCLGVADNLDYWRVARPAGITVQAQPKQGFFVVCSFPVTTPDLAALPSTPATIAWLARRLSSGPTLDLRAIGISYLLITVALLLVAVLLGGSAAAALAVTWVIADPGFLLFFNSLYAEPCMIVGLLGVALLLPLAGLVTRDPARRGAWATWALLPCAALAGLSKMQYAPLPAVLLLACLVGLAMRRARPRRDELAFLVLLAGLAVAAPWHFAHGSGPRFPAANDYDAVFRGIAVLAHDPTAALDRLGVPESLRDQAGTDYYDAAPGERAAARAALSGLSRWRLALLYAGDREALERAALHAARELWRVHTNPRGNFTEAESGELGRTYGVGFQFSRWRAVLLGWLPNGAVWMFLLAAAAWLIAAALRSTWTAADGLTLLLVLWVPVQCAVVILGDGLVNLQQHLLGARLGLDLLLVLAALRGAEAVARAMRGRRRPAGSAAPVERASG